MRSERGADQDADLGVTAALRLVRRRWPILLLFLLILPIVAYNVAKQQSPRWSAEASVILTVGTDELIPGSAEGGNQPAERLANTQAELARSPVFLREVQARLPDLTLDEVEANTAVEPAPNSNILIFQAEWGSPEGAERLATEYAKAFPDYLQRLRVVRLESLLAQLDARRRELLTDPTTNAEAIRTLESSRQQLFALQAVQQGSADFLRPAGSAEQIRPRLVLSMAAGLLLGLLLGLAVAGLVELLDTRVREDDELEDLLGVPRLGRLRPPRKVKGQGSKVTTLVRPDDPQADEYRTLAVNLDFETMGKQVGAIQISSALMGEGKSTTIANLAVTMARQGRDVILVDADLRRPSLHKLFDVPRSPGLTEGALGGGPLADCLLEVDLRTGVVTPPAPVKAVEHVVPGSGATSGLDLPAASSPQAWRDDLRGRLRVLPAGVQPPQVGDFLTRGQVVQAVRALVASCDLLLVDSPPLLGVGDGLRATSVVDAVVVVSNVRLLRRDDVRELARTLRSAPVQVLGFVTTGSAVDAKRYRYYSESTRRGRGRLTKSNR